MWEIPTNERKIIMSNLSFCHNAFKSSAADALECICMWERFTIITTTTSANRNNNNKTKYFLENFTEIQLAESNLKVNFCFYQGVRFIKLILEIRRVLHHKVPLCMLSFNTLDVNMPSMP